MTDLIDQTALEAALDDWLAGAADETETAPETQEQTDRLIGAWRGVQRRIAEVKTLVAERKRLLAAWEEDQMAALEGRAAQLEQLLEGWTRAQHERTGRQSWKLPNGTLALRKQQPKIISLGDGVPVDEAETLLGPDVIKRIEEVRLGEVKARTVPGDIIPGMQVDGYTAHDVVVPQDDPEREGTSLPGAVLLVPKQLGFKVTAS